MTEKPVRWWSAAWYQGKSAVTLWGKCGDLPGCEDASLQAGRQHQERWAQRALPTLEPLRP